MKIAIELTVDEMFEVMKKNEEKSSGDEDKEKEQGWSHISNSWS